MRCHAPECTFQIDNDQAFLIIQLCLFFRQSSYWYFTVKIKWHIILRCLQIKCNAFRCRIQKLWQNAVFRNWDRIFLLKIRGCNFDYSQINIRQHAKRQCTFLLTEWKQNFQRQLKHTNFCTKEYSRTDNHAVTNCEGFCHIWIIKLWTQIQNTVCIHIIMTHSIFIHKRISIILRYSSYRNCIYINRKLRCRNIIIKKCCNLR